MTGDLVLDEFLLCYGGMLCAEDELLLLKGADRRSLDQARCLALAADSLSP
jgi:hypothetical protein